MTEIWRVTKMAISYREAMGLTEEDMRLIAEEEKKIDNFLLTGANFGEKYSSETYEVKSGLREKALKELVARYEAPGKGWSVEVIAPSHDGGPYLRFRPA